MLSIMTAVIASIEIYKAVVKIIILQ